MNTVAGIFPYHCRPHGRQVDHRNRGRGRLGGRIEQPGRGRGRGGPNMDRRDREQTRNGQRSTEEQESTEAEHKSKSEASGPTEVVGAREDWVTAQPTVPNTKAPSSSEASSKVPARQRSQYQPVAVGARENTEDSRKLPARAPRGRGRGWREKLGSSTTPPSAPVGRSGSSGITVIEPAEKKLPPEQTEDASTNSPPLESPGQPVSTGVPSSAHPKRIQDQPPPDHGTSTPPTKEATSSAATLPSKTTAATSQVIASPQAVKAAQTSKPKRYSSTRQRTGVGSEALETLQQQQQEQPLLPQQGTTMVAPFVVVAFQSAITDLVSQYHKLVGRACTLVPTCPNLSDYFVGLLGKWLVASC